MSKNISTFFAGLLCVAFLTAGCSAPPPPLPSENVTSDALLEECPELLRLTENALGKDGELVGQAMSFFRERRASFHSLDDFIDEISTKEGLNGVEQEELQRLSTGIFSLEMFVRGTPVNPELPDIGAYWIDQGVKYVRMWCP